MTRIQDVCVFLESHLPLELAESWDNVGLLLGDRSDPVFRIMTCLTLTPESVAEGVRRNVNLIVAHHPLPFRPLKNITADSIAGKLVWQLARAGVSVFSPHTAFDSAATGINHQFSKRLELHDIRPMTPSVTMDSLGSGRMGRLTSSQTVSQMAARLQQAVGCPHVQYSGPTEHQCRLVGIACGSGGSFLEAAIRAGCDTLITGEASFHTCLEAHANGVGLFLVGHFHSERFAVEELADVLASQFSDCEVWASDDETDPLTVIV